jgi:FkbM family methyltransferase
LAKNLGADRHIAVEPEESNFNLLCRNVAANGLSVECFQAAVGPREESVFLTKGSTNANFVDKQGETEVKCLLASRFFRASDRLLAKIDVEGAEWDVLDEMLPHCPEEAAIFIEVHEGGSALFRLRHLVEPLGFSLTVLRQHGLCVECFMVRMSADRNPDATD